MSNLLVSFKIKFVTVSLYSSFEYRRNQSFWLFVWWNGSGDVKSKTTKVRFCDLAINLSILYAKVIHWKLIFDFTYDRKLE